MDAFKERKPFNRSMNSDRLVELSQWESRWGIIPVFGTLHLTGAQIGSDERVGMRDGFHDWLAKGTIQS